MEKSIRLKVIPAAVQKLSLMVVPYAKNRIILTTAELMDMEDQIGPLQKVIHTLLAGTMIAMVGGMQIRNQHIAKIVGKLSTIISIISTKMDMQ